MREDRAVNRDGPEPSKMTPSGEGATSERKRRVTRRRLVRAGAVAATTVAATVYMSPDIRSFKITQTAHAFSF